VRTAPNLKCHSVARALEEFAERIGETEGERVGCYEVELST